LPRPPLAGRRRADTPSTSPALASRLAVRLAAEMRWDGPIIAALLVAAFGIFWLFYVRDTPTDGEPPRNEIRLTDEQRVAIMLQIEARGFDCPMVAFATDEGQNATGSVQQVDCGQVDKVDPLKHFRYRVTVKPDRTFIVTPWE
jgi:hypothetical protein